MLNICEPVNLNLCFLERFEDRRQDPRRRDWGDFSHGMPAMKLKHVSLVLQLAPGEEENCFLVNFV